MTQFLPGMLGILVLRHLRPLAILAGILAGDAVAIVLYEFAIPLGGINPGFIGLAVNAAIVFATLYLSPGPERRPIASMPLRAT